MKKFLIIVLAFALLAGTAGAANQKIRFSWDQTDVGRVNFWRLCWGTKAGGPYKVGCLDIHKDDLQDKKYTATINYPSNRLTRYYFVLVALKDGSHFSKNSNEVSHAVDLRTVPAPFNLTVEIVPAAPPNARIIE